MLTRLNINLESINISERFPRTRQERDQLHRSEPDLYSRNNPYQKQIPWKTLTEVLEETEAQYCHRELECSEPTAKWQWKWQQQQ